MKRTIDIEALLGWAYCDELPKVAHAGAFVAPRAASAWGAISAQGALMAEAVRDGRPNDYGVLPGLSLMDEPLHPDARRIGDIVNRLGGVRFALPEGWRPFGDMTALSDDDRAALDAQALATLAGPERVTDIDARHLVIHHAIMGGAPDWRGGQIVRSPVTYDNGRPMFFRRETRVDSLGLAYETEMIVTRDRRKGGYPPGSYQKAVFRPSPERISRRRADYQVWLAALDLICDWLADEPLEDFEVTQSPRALAPWIEGEAAHRIVREAVGAGGMDVDRAGGAARGGLRGARRGADGVGRLVEVEATIEHPDYGAVRVRRFMRQGA